MLDKLARECHTIAKEHGFWEDADSWDPTWCLSRCMLITTEVAELAEEFRKIDLHPAAVAEEIVDIIIRVLDFAGGLGLSLDMPFETKMEKNRARPYKHGKTA